MYLPAVWPRQSMVWRLASLRVGLCPSTLDLQWRQDKDREGKPVVFHLPLICPCLAVWSFSTVPGMEAGDLAAYCPVQKCEVYGSLTLLVSTPRDCLHCQYWK